MLESLRQERSGAAYQVILAPTANAWLRVYCPMLCTTIHGCHPALPSPLRMDGTPQKRRRWSSTRSSTVLPRSLRRRESRSCKLVFPISHRLNHLLERKRSRMSHHFDTKLAKEDPSINVCDFYLFEGTPGTTVMAMTVNPDAGLSVPRRSAQRRSLRIPFRPERRCARRGDLQTSVRRTSPCG